MTGYPTDDELALRAQSKVAHEVDRALNEAGSVRASVLRCEECEEVGTHKGTCSQSAMRNPEHPFHQQASVLGHRKPPWPRVLGHRFDGLREVEAQAERVTVANPGVAAAAESGQARPRSASVSRETAVWFTDDELIWLTALLGELPLIADPHQLYEKTRRALTMLAVLDAGKGT